MKYYILSCEVEESKLADILGLLAGETLGVWTEPIKEPSNQPKFCFPKSKKMERSGKGRRPTHETHTGRLALEYAKSKFPAAIRPVDLEDEYVKFGFARSGATAQLAALAKEGFIDRKGRGFYVWKKPVGMVDGSKEQPKS